MAELQLEYFNPKAPGSFSGLSKFQKHHPQYSLNELAKTLSGYRSYTLHKPVRKRFPRNKTKVYGIDSMWDVDLSDLSKLAQYNDGYNYLFCVIDVFSKKAWVIPITSKTAPSLLIAWKQLFSVTERRPESVRSDKGGEFNNRLLLNFFKDNRIHFYVTQNEDTKAAIVERFQRTLKGKMWRYFTHNRTYRYIDVLPQLLESYNNTYHRSIGVAPNNVSHNNETKIRKRLYGKKSKKKKTKYYFSVGDYVRITSTKRAFKKAYEGEWSDEVFVVIERIARVPPVYRIKDLNGEPIEGTFYRQELQKITFTDKFFIVEEVLKQRRRRGKIEYFVKWLGYPDSFNSWVDKITV